MVTRKQIVEKAREYIGTPFLHQGRVKGRALDCVGLPLMIAEELELFDKNGVPLNGSTYKTYSPQPLGSYVHELCSKHLMVKPVREMLPGDLLTLQVVTAPCHVAIVSEVNSVLHIIHAYTGAEKCVEHALDHKWRRRIVGCFEFPGVVNG